MSVVCIVEDQGSVAQGMERLLVALGHEVTVCHDGLEAYAQIFEAPPDLLVLDVLLPSLNGLALARLVKRNEDLRHVRILVVSSEMSERASGTSEAEVDAVLTKPFDGDAFVREVSRLLGAAATGPHAQGASPARGAPV